MGDYDSLRKMLPVANEKTGTVTIKGICDNNIRRIPILQTPTYDELCFMMHRMFRPHLSTNLDNLVLFYKDEDGDQVLITDDMDISHALTHSSVIRITVYDKESLPPPNSQSCLLSALKDLSLSSKSLAALKVGLQDVQKAVEKILQALPSESDETSQSSTKSPDQIPKTKPLSTADMAELLDSAHVKATTPGSSSVAPTEAIQQLQLQLPTQSQVLRSAATQQLETQSQVQHFAASQQPPQQQPQQPPQRHPQQSPQQQPQQQPQQPLQQDKPVTPTAYQTDSGSYSMTPYGLLSSNAPSGPRPTVRDHTAPMQQHQQPPSQQQQTHPPQRQHSTSTATGYNPYPSPSSITPGSSPHLATPQQPHALSHPQPQPPPPPQQLYGQHTQRPYSYPATYPVAPQPPGPASSSPYSQPHHQSPYYNPQGQVSQTMSQHPGYR